MSGSSMVARRVVAFLGLVVLAGATLPAAVLLADAIWLLGLAG